MKSERIGMLKKFIENEPADPFNYYALAIEYTKTDSLKAADLFDHLLTKFSDYLPTYYTAAEFFQQTDHIEKAKKIIEQGIELARVQQNLKTLNELRSALMNLDD